MKLSEPQRFTISAQNESYFVINDKGRNTFVAPATVRCPKLYVFEVEGVPVYVGQTVQGMAARMRLGFLADGTSGYYGYRWRHDFLSAQLLVWCLEDVAEEDEQLALECIESEIVYCYRVKYNQWPKYQTEIHFHQTTSEHREIAAKVFAFFTRIEIAPNH